MRFHFQLREIFEASDPSWYENLQPFSLSFQCLYRSAYPMISDRSEIRDTIYRFQSSRVSMRKLIEFCGIEKVIEKLMSIQNFKLI